MEKGAHLSLMIAVNAKPWENKIFAIIVMYYSYHLNISF